MRYLPMVLAGLLAETGAQAATPRLVPLRDVTVEYQVSQPDRGPITVQAEIAAGRPLARVSGQDFPGTLIVDLAGNQATLIFPPLRAYQSFSIGHGGFPPQGASFTPTGQRIVAGLPCVTYHVTTRRGGGTVCLTVDGVILAAEGSDDDNHRGALIATRVIYAPLPPDAFQPPPGFSNLAGLQGLGALLPHGGQPQ